VPLKSTHSESLSAWVLVGNQRLGSFLGAKPKDWIVRDGLTGWFFSDSGILPTLEADCFTFVPALSCLFCLFAFLVTTRVCGFILRFKGRRMLNW